MKNQALEDCIRALKKRFPPPKFKNRKKKVMNRSGMLIAPDVTSTTHPDQTKWYQNSNAELAWGLPALFVPGALRPPRPPGPGG